MFDFLTGFLLGIIFTVSFTVFGIYKLLLKSTAPPSNNASRQLTPYPSLSQIQFSKYVRHSIPKYTMDTDEVNIESCMWLNTIAATLCVEALSSPVLVENLHKKLHDILNKPEDKPDVLGKIVISDINMGTGLPQIAGIRVLSHSIDDTLDAEIALQYNGGASFTISTELWVNWPTPKFASLPVSLHASFDHFEGILAASVKWNAAHKAKIISVNLRAPPVFQLRIGSTIGHTTKLVNVAQISGMLENLIYSFVNKELVSPSGFELEVEDGKVTAVRKLSPNNSATSSSVPKITAGGEKKGGDLSRRSFSVSTAES